ncbi:MAG: ATP-binding protein [Oribacterium sp.]|nr:ATP-binding protein [Oribacterium sp.]
MRLLTGEELKQYVYEKLKIMDYGEKREIYGSLFRYLHSNDPRVLCLYGLRRTGKTVMMGQAIYEINSYEDCLYILCENDDRMSDLKKELQGKSQKYLFLDEVTKLSNFITTCSILADLYSSAGRRVVLSGTDSLGFRVAKMDELFDRVSMLHTTYIPYREFHRLLKLDIDMYIQYGGMLSMEGVLYNSTGDIEEDRNKREPYYEYMDGAIISNIMHTLDSWDYGRHYGDLQQLKEEGLMEPAIRKVLDNETRQFLLSTINDSFDGKMRGSLVDLVEKSLPEVDTEPLSSDSLIQRNRALLRVPKMLSRKLTDREVSSIKIFLLELDVLIAGTPDREDYIFTQPGLRYYQAKVLSDALDLEPAFFEYPPHIRSKIKQKLDEGVKGHLLEDIVYSQLYMECKNTNYVLTRFTYPMGGEFDAVVFDTSINQALIMEVKHSKVISYAQQTKHLNNAEICDTFEEKNKIPIFAKAVIYNGENAVVDQINYINAGDFLSDPIRFLKHIFTNGFIFVDSEKLGISVKVYSQIPDPAAEGEEEAQFFSPGPWMEDKDSKNKMSL